MTEVLPHHINPTHAANPVVVDEHQFREEGYCLVRGVFSPDEIQILRQACDELCDLARDFQEDRFEKQTYFNMFRQCDPFDQKLQQQAVVAGTLRRVTYPYAINEKINQQRRNPKLLQCVSALLTNDLVQIVNQVNFNPPNIGTGWGWHQDYRFRRHGIENLLNNFVQCLTAIDPSSQDNGGFRLIPKIHKLGALKLDLEVNDAEKYFDASAMILPTLNPGDTIFFNAFVIHGSSANQSPNPRRVFINGYANAKLATHGNPVLRNGEIVLDRKAIMEFEQDREKLPLAAKY